MLVSLNWLKEYVNIDDVSTEEFTEKMTMSGTIVEGIAELGSELSNVVVGKILSIEKHPDADKLVVTKVDVGEEIIQIVTGAHNIKVDDCIPVALIGARLNGIKIKKSKLRGIESQGMMCSAQELGMNTSLLAKAQTEGIFILKNKYKLGSDVRPILGLDDKVVDFELTANRNDCLSIVGIAREVAATFDTHLVLPIVHVEEGKENISDYLKISIEDGQMCPRYVARMIKINRIEPSPDWMQRRLINCGIRPINNIVDVTNYVMLDMGQPLHAFDYQKLNSKEILVRKAKNGEVLTTLDSVERKLDQDMMVITNGIEPVAIAGVMGGENSEIDHSTKWVVIESANFNRKSVRHTGRKLGLRSEAANRFEKGVDSEIADKAADYAAQLLVEIGAGEVVKGKIDIYPNKVQTKTVELDPDWFNKFIGVNISKEEIKEYLERLFLDVEEKGNLLSVSIPSYRQDLEIREDIAEEIARIFGYNNIPNTIIKGVASQGGRTKEQFITKEMRNLLNAKGFYEILTTSFTGESKLLDLNIEKDDPYINGVKLVNPLGEDSSIMRPTLIPGLLQVISHNYNHKVQEGMFYEFAVVYKDSGKLGEDLPLEEKNLSLGIYGEKNFFHLKGYIELLLESLRINDGIVYEKTTHPSFHPQRAAALMVNGKELGVMGEVHPKVVEGYSLPSRTYIGEIKISKLIELAKDRPQFTELPKYPGVSRDMALLLEDKVRAKDVEDIVRAIGGKLLEEFTLFDIYRGEQIPKGYKSMAYSLVFRSKDKTLTDGEINEVFTQIVEELKVKLDAKLRD